MTPERVAYAEKRIQRLEAKKQFLLTNLKGLLDLPQMTDDVTQQIENHRRVQ